MPSTRLVPAAPPVHLQQDCSGCLDIACADFTGPVAIKSGNLGRGLFATQSVTVGQLLLVSKAYAVASSKVQSVKSPQVWPRATRCLLCLCVFLVCVISPHP